MKATPKSCSCTQCRRGKHTKTGHFFMNREERSLRRQAKRALHNINPDEEVVVQPAPKGDYYD